MAGWALICAAAAQCPIHFAQVRRLRLARRRSAPLEWPARHTKALVCRYQVSLINLAREIDPPPADHLPLTSGEELRVAPQRRPEQMARIGLAARHNETTL